MDPFFIGPIAPERNPPINPQYFQPSVFDITAISMGVTTTITTSVVHNYVIGQLVRLLIPPTFGATGLNEIDGYVLAIPSTTQVTTTIYSVGISPFIANPSYGPTPPQIVATGDVNTGIISTTGVNIPTTNVPGAFINISPI